MRTGTTLVQTILCNAAGANPMIAEANYFYHMVRLYKHGKRTFDVFVKHYFADFGAYQRFSRDWACAHLRGVQERWAPCRHLVLKQPDLVRDFEDVFELVEGAKFLVVVRDPRDTITSIIEVAKRQAARGEVTRLTRMGQDVQQLADFFNWHYDPIVNTKSDAFRRATLWLRYEDVVDDVAATLDRVRAFTGLEFTNFEPERVWERRAADLDVHKQSRMEAPWTSELYGQGVSRQAVGRYREQLTPDQVAAVERGCAHICRAFGYH